MTGLLCAARAALFGAILALATSGIRPAQAADQVIAGSLGGQAPLWAIYVAMHKGFFAAEGLDVKLNFARSGSAVTQQVTAGSLNVALSVGATDPIRAIAKGADIAVVRIVGRSAPYVLIGKHEFKSIKDLKGKTIAVGGPHDIATVYVARMMAANGLKAGDYKTVAGGVARARFAALKAGVADAAVVLPPLNFVANAQGFMTLGIAADYVKDLPFTAMAVYRPWASTHTADVKRILDAVDKSVAWLADTSHRDEAVALLVNVAHSSKKNAEASYDYLRRIAFFEPSSKISRKVLRNLTELEKSRGTVDAGFKIDRLVMPKITQLTD
jgi:ABC-type nitrate/sulfonate/bicarbonate transport system substrate-binding protein